MNTKRVSSFNESLSTTPLPASIKRHLFNRVEDNKKLTLVKHKETTFKKTAFKETALKENSRSLNKQSTSSLLGKITEIITSDEQEESLAMLLPLLATLSKDDRWFAWVSPPKNLPKSLLKQAGIALDKVMLLYPDEQNSALSLATKALSAGTCHAVISWSGSLSEQDFVHLQQSASTGASHGILIRCRQPS